VNINKQARNASMTIIFEKYYDDHKSSQIRHRTVT